MGLARARAPARRAARGLLARDRRWTVRFFHRLLAGQNEAMQKLMLAQVGLTKAVNMTLELEALLGCLCRGYAETRITVEHCTTCERFLVVEVIDCLTATMVGMRVPNQDAVARSTVPEVLASLLGTPLAALAAHPAHVSADGGRLAAEARLGEDERLAVAWGLRRSAINCLDAMVEGRQPGAPVHGLLAAKLDDRDLQRLLAECAARHEPSPPSRITPPYDLLLDLGCPQHEVTEIVGDLIVALCGLRLKLYGVSAAEGPFRELLAEVDVSWHGRIERVVFALPEFASSLTVVAKQKFETTVDLTSTETRMRELFNQGHAIMKEATYLHAISKQSDWYAAINDHYLTIKLRLYFLALLLNLHVMLNLRGRGDFFDSFRRERGESKLHERFPYRNIVTILMAAPVCLGYAGLTLFSLVCAAAAWQMGPRRAPSQLVARFDTGEGWARRSSRGSVESSPSPLW